LSRKSSRGDLGDFTTSVRVIPISLLAIGIGAICAYVALALLRLIGLFTNLFYYERWNTAMVSPAANHLGIYAVLVPVGGAFIIGSTALEIFAARRRRARGSWRSSDSVALTKPHERPV
jgi:CIC family chloride channel protein